MENHCYTFTIFDGNATAPPEMVPAKDMAFQQFIETARTLNFLACLDAALRDSSVSRCAQGYDFLNGYSWAM
jgi:hypothetical protein